MSMAALCGATDDALDEHRLFLKWARGTAAVTLSKPIFSSNSSSELVWGSNGRETGNQQILPKISLIKSPNRGPLYPPVT